MQDLGIKFRSKAQDSQARAREDNKATNIYQDQRQQPEQQQKQDHQRNRGAHNPRNLISKGKEASPYMNRDFTQPDERNKQQPPEQTPRKKHVLISTDAHIWDAVHNPTVNPKDVKTRKI